METPYSQAHAPPPQSYAHHQMPPNMHLQEANYRNHAPPGSQYHGSTGAQPASNQGYAYNAPPMPQPHSREQMPPPLQIAEPGNTSPQSTVVPSSATPVEPPTHSMVEQGRRYSLEVVQQPRRARMCGFGDKDRRPITPPPCIRLMIVDALKGTEIDVNDIEHSMFVLNVDLWSADGLREVNLVRHAGTSPSMTGSMPSPYGPPSEIGTPVYPSPQSATPGHMAAVREHGFSYPVGPQHPPSGGPPPPTYGGYAHAPPPAQITHYGQQQHQGQYQPSSQMPPGAYPPRSASPSGYSRPSSFSGSVGYYDSRGADMYSMDPNMQRMAIMTGTPQATGMYTRNLIGSLTASAFRLSDPNDKTGIWFVLQDLSVRTEGNFRLRFSFVNVGTTTKPSNTNAMTQSHFLNNGKAPILASCFSEVFTVYSAKKFPGVVESTPLSKCFATQGIKIPIRKDGPGKTTKEDYDDD